MARFVLMTGGMTSACARRCRDAGGSLAGGIASWAGRLLRRRGGASEASDSASAPPAKRQRANDRSADAAALAAAEAAARGAARDAARDAAQPPPQAAAGRLGSEPTVPLSRMAASDGLTEEAGLAARSERAGSGSLGSVVQPAAAEGSRSNADSDGKGGGGRGGSENRTSDHTSPQTSVSAAPTEPAVPGDAAAASVAVTAAAAAFGDETQYHAAEETLRPAESQVGSSLFLYTSVHAV